MSPDQIVTRVAQQVLAAHRSRLDGARTAAILTRPSPIALTLAGLGDIAQWVEAGRGWETCYWLASPAARAEWHATVAALTERFPRLDDWALVGTVDDRPMAAGRFSRIDLDAGYAVGALNAIRLGEQAARR